MAKLPVTLAFTVIDRASKSIQKITSQVEKLNKVTGSTGKAMKDPFANVERTTRKMKDFAGTATMVGGALTASITLPIVGMGAAMVKSAADFQMAMADLKGRGPDATADQLNKMGEAARKMGQETGVGAMQAIEAMTALTKAGANADQILSGAAKASVLMAKAESINTESAAELISDTMHIFKIDDWTKAAHVADVLSKSAGISSTSIQNVTDSMKYASLGASSYGLQIEDVAAALATLGNLGIKGETAGTTIRNMMSRIGGNAAIQDKLSAKGAKVGSFFQDDGKTLRTFPEIFKALHDLNLSAVDFQNIFGRLIGDTVRKATENFDKFGADLVEIKANSDGFLNTLAQSKIDTFWGKIEKLKATFTDIGIGLAKDGTLENLSKFVDILNDLLIGFNNLGPGMKTFLFVTAGIAAVAGPLIAVIGALAFAYVGLSTATAGVGLGVALGTIGALGVAIIGTAAAITFLIVKWDDLAAGARIIWSDMKAWAKEFFDFTDFGFDKLFSKFNMLYKLSPMGLGSNFVEKMYDGVDRLLNPAGANQKSFTTPLPSTNDQIMGKLLRPEQFMLNKMQSNSHNIVEFLNTPPGTTVNGQRAAGDIAFGSDTGRTLNTIPSRKPRTAGGR